MNGYIRTTHDKDGNFLGPFPSGNLDSGIFHLLDDMPIPFEQVLSRVVKYNNCYPESPFDIDNLELQLIELLELGIIGKKAILMKNE